MFYNFLYLHLIRHRILRLVSLLPNFLVIEHSKIFQIVLAYLKMDVSAVKINFIRK